MMEIVEAGSPAFLPSVRVHNNDNFHLSTRLQCC
jgi:hypothetical protein